MSPKVVLITSLLVNAGLGFALVNSNSNKAPASDSSTQPESPHNSVTAKKLAAKNASPVIITNEVKFNFDWRQVESSDYKDYITRLRGIGCPEATIRDIIIADIDKLYEPKFAALRDITAYQPQEFWRESYYGNRTRKVDPVKQAQTKALAEERSALIKDLLGVDETELRKEMYAYYDDGSKEKLAFLSPEKQEQAKELEKKYNKLRSDIYSKAGGMIDQDTQKELAALQKKMLTEMKSFMTPAEAFEYDIRTSDTARNMKYEFRGFEPTEEEFRTIFASKRAQEDLRTSLTAAAGEKMSAEQYKELSAATKKAEDDLKTSLGAERYEEMQRSKDYSYQQLANAAPFLGYDKAAAARVYNMKAEAEKAANDVRRNTSLSPEERTKALQDIRSATEKAVQQEIGERGLNYYKRQGGYWIRNLSPTARTITQ